MIFATNIGKVRFYLETQNDWRLTSSERALLAFYMGTGSIFLGRRTPFKLNIKILGIGLYFQIIIRDKNELF